MKRREIHPEWGKWTNKCGTCGCHKPCLFDRWCIVCAKGREPARAQSEALPAWGCALGPEPEVADDGMYAKALREMEDREMELI